MASYLSPFSEVYVGLVELTSIPSFEHRLIFRGKQLQWEQTIAQCGIQRDINLQLFGRIRSTEHHALVTLYFTLQG
jgi:E3 ubiquitin-protein ligase NEDD4